MRPLRDQLPEPLPDSPLPLLERWLAEAVETAAQPNPNAMVLATVDAHGAPSARVVLCKELQPQAGYVTFFTNYQSRKGRELDANPRAAAVFHWDALGRQVRLEGEVTRTTAAESDAYFASRHWQSRLSAWASRQSAPLEARAQLLRTLEHTAERFDAPSPLASDATAADPGVVIARPTHWGGFHLWLSAVELWVEGAARLHDRARWERRTQKSGGQFSAGPWRGTRLQP